MNPYSLAYPAADLLTPGSYVTLRNAKIEMFRNNMRLAVPSGGKVEPAPDAAFSVAEDNNLRSGSSCLIATCQSCPPLLMAHRVLPSAATVSGCSLVEYELVQVPALAAAAAAQPSDAAADAAADAPAVQDAAEPEAAEEQPSE